MTTPLADTFCKSVPDLPSIWDPTRLTLAHSCLRKHYYATMRGLRLNGGTPVHFEWGKAYHACTEYFDLCLLAGKSRENACLQTLAYALTISWDTEVGAPRWGQWVELFQCTSPEFVQGERDPSTKVLNRARCSFARKAWQEIPLMGAVGSAGRCANCGNPVAMVRKWFPLHVKKTRANLLRAVALYCDTPGLPPYAFEDKAPATEVQHRIPLPLISPDDLPYELLVNIDSVVDFEGAPAIRERKTTGLSALNWHFWQQFEMSPQIDTYDLVGNVIYADGDLPVRVLLEATRVSQSGETEIQRAPIYIGEGRRAEWFAELQELIEDVERRSTLALGTEADGSEASRHFPRRTTSCITKNGVCPYWRLCSAEPSEREGLIASDYHREDWNPVTAQSEEEADG